ncbi:hypothetical protein [Cesiribacter andamanensis]|uniref:Uncharacterized protein n=1 Tax=Cesiribacter andamanensis AMV16 TaxID=1279009 RepID=M7NQC9_9BACT|nr:hypothetical protein [Cesiribacter andamanensis]EMR03930.1 hypothetical protein ADICEAN_00897 [Cesiribacter andamanensis AMV16]
MPYIHLQLQLSRACYCLGGGGPLKDRLVFAALSLNELDLHNLPATSLTSRYNLLLKELGAGGENPSEQAIEGAISRLSEEQQQALCLALQELYQEAQQGEVFT